VKQILDPQQRQLYSGLHFETGTYTFITSQAGEHQVCFSNEMARWTSKVVQFELWRGEAKTNFAGQPLTKGMEKCH
jgi:hypothetical protein